MNILIVDDEPLARGRLRALVGEIQPEAVITEAASGTEALARITGEPPDVVLLDIRMPGMDGLEVARHLKGLEEPPAVIFTTAYDSHALAAFETHAVGYLLKPVRKQRLATALAQAQSLTRAQLAGMDAERLPQRPRTHLSANTRSGIRLLPVDDIRVLRAEQKYVAVYLNDNPVLIDDSLNALEAEFGERFLRVHRNALVALAYIASLDKDTHGHQQLRLNGVEQAVEVSRRMTALVKRRLKAR